MNKSLKFNQVPKRGVRGLFLVRFFFGFKVKILCVLLTAPLALKTFSEFASKAKLVKVEKEFFFNLFLEKSTALSLPRVVFLFDLKKSNLCPSKLS